MNKYPAWLNLLVLVVVLGGVLFALPNIYGSVPAVQIAAGDGAAYEQRELDEFVAFVRNTGATPEAAYLKDGRAVMRFDRVEDQERAFDALRDEYQREASVAQTLAPRLPTWLRSLGLNPMSLGLDLRGGVYVLLEVDMEKAIESRLKSYQQDIDDRLREANIRHRVDLDGNTITVRLTGAGDMEAARNVVRRARQGLPVALQVLPVQPGFPQRPVGVRRRAAFEPARRLT